MAFVKTHKDDTIRITRAITHLPPDEAGRVYDVITPTLASNGHFDPQAVDAVKRSLVDLGQVKSLPDNRLLFTEKFLPSSGD